MSESFRQKLNGLSAVERLKATDKYLTEMRGILASMDEIAALRKQRGEAVSDEYGGYKRSTVEDFIRELEKQKEGILSEIAREEARRAAPAPVKESAPAVKEDLPANKGESAVASFRKGDPSLAIESMYTGLSMDIEKMRDDILQEMKYTYKQDMAIYDDLSAKIDAIKPADTSALEETLRPLGENLNAVSGSLTALDEKLNALQPLDYDAIAERVASKMVSGIDYDALAQHIVGIMTGGAAGAAAGAAAAGASERSLSELEKKIDGIKSALDGAISVKQMPEFRKLDTLIAEYLRTLSYDTIPDLLITANGIKDTANRYIVSGNVLRGETMLSDLRIRLSRVNVWGSSAVAAVTDAVAAHKLPVTYSSEAMASFGEAVKAYEQAPAFPGEDLTAELLRAKKAAFNDTDRESLDRDTFAEMLEIGQEMNGGEADKGRIDNLTELKKELMSFNLSYFIDLSPAIYEEKEPAAPAAPAADTQAILDAISNLQVVQAAPAAAPQQDAKLQGKLEELAKNKPNLSVKKPRQLRPAVSSKDNKVEKTDQPLRVVRRKISLTEEGETLSKQVVDELAQKIANSMVK